MRTLNFEKRKDTEGETFWHSDHGYTVWQIRCGGGDCRGTKHWAAEGLQRGRQDFHTLREAMEACDVDWICYRGLT